MAQRVVDYLFRVAQDNVSARFRTLERAQEQFQQRAATGWRGFEQASSRALSRVGMAARRQLGQIGREAAELLSNKFVQIFGAAGGGLALKKGISDLADLGDQMTGIAIKLRQPVESLGDLRREILAFSQDLGITDSAENIARAVNTLIGADFEKPDALNIAKASAKAAAAAQTDSATVAKGLSAILKGFNMEGSRAEEILGKMIRATDIGVVEMEDLANAMVDVVPAAIGLGASIEEVLALLETLSVSGVSNAAEASTSIGAMLRKFRDPEFKKNAARVGIQVLDEEGNFKSPVEILDMISKKLKQIEGEGKQAKFLNRLLGNDVRAERGIFPLLERVRILQTAVDDLNRSGDRLPEAFQESAKRLGAKRDQIKNMLVAAGIDIATLFEPGMDMFSKWLNKTFDPRSASGTFADQVRGMIQMTAEEVEAGGWGKWFWERVLVDPLKFWTPKIAGMVGGIAGANHPMVGLGRGFGSFMRDPMGALSEGAKNFSVGGVILEPKIEIHNQIDAATGKTRTSVTVQDPQEWGRRVPLEP